MTVTAGVNWVEGLQMVGRAAKGPAVVLDNPEGAGGPTPMEMLLIGVAGCTGMDVVSILQKKRVDFSAFIVRIEGDRAEEHPRRYTEIRIEYVVTGRSVKPRDVERAIELSETKYCGAIASLNAGFTTRYRIVEEG